ncbi:MAG: hypothetical protein E7173_01410 [Firmicutes bacterium]|nr:hypothetical protein [Bacillota bacterium]
MSSEYERLKKAGYTEEQIQLELSRLSQIKIGDDHSLGEHRSDKSAVVIDSTGLEQKTSSIMMGYNKNGIVLENGEYVSSTEVEQALASELSHNGEDVVYICTKTGKKLSQSDLIEAVIKHATRKHSTLSLTADSTIKNQDSARVTIHDTKSGSDYDKGIFMLGNKGIQLPNGEYVLEREIKEALEQYVILTPKKIPETKSPEVYEVIKRLFRKYSWIPMLIAEIIIILKGFGYDDQLIDKYMTERYTSASGQVSMVHELTDEEVRRTTHQGIVQLKTGETIELDKGIGYYASSDHKYGGNDRKGVIGNSLRPEGDYNIDYFSIIHNGKIVKVVYQKGVRLEDVIRETSEELNVSIEELEAWMHAGGPVSGWISIDDVVASRVEKYGETIRTKIDKENRLNGYSENFDGKTITFNNGDKEVTITVVDQDGNLLKSGAIVAGSDGEKYCIDSLTLEEKEKTTTVQVNEGKKLNWSVHNIGLDFALATAGIGLIATIFTKRTKKETTTMTDEQIYDFIAKKKQEFAETSEFQRAVETVIRKKPTVSYEQALRDELVNQNITLEDVEKMGGIKF